MKGTLYVLDGLDGCGKTTQTELVAKGLQQRGGQIRVISFPDYRQESSALVRMYLNGEFSDDPDQVNAYAASSFYAVDRYASFKKFWEKDYQAGHTILATRYVSSNAIHQMGKLPKEQWQEYLFWLSDFEYGRLGLPKPDRTIFLNMDRAVADRLLLERYAGDVSRKDIHERDRAYLLRCQEAAEYAAKVEGWDMIPCSQGDKPLPPEKIAARILALLERKGKLSHE